MGGDSANFGDVPTQALLNVARIYSESKGAGVFGLRSNTIGYNYPSIKNFKDTVVSRVGRGGNKRYYESLGIHVIMGQAHFISPHEISVNRRHISAINILIATGAQWAVPPVENLEKIGFLTPQTAIDVNRPPKSLLVIGGGSTGLEFARLFSAKSTKQPREL